MIFQILLLFTVSTGALLALLTIAGATIYDVRHIRRNRQQSRHPHAQRYRQRPLISVIIPALNDADTIERTLRSVTQNSHRKVEIVIIDRGSQDVTKRLVKQFMATQPRKTIRLSVKRKPKSVPETVTEAARKFTTGTLLLWLTPGQLLDSQTLQQAVNHFNTEPGLNALRCNRQVRSSWSLGGLLQCFALLLGQRSRKCVAVSPGDAAQITDGVIYTREALLSPDLGHHRVCYANDAMIHIPPPVSLYDFLRHRHRLHAAQWKALINHRQLLLTADSGWNTCLLWLRLPFALSVRAAALLAPVLMTYFLYLALHLHQPVLYAMSWVVIILFTISAISADEHLTLRQKTGYAALAPMLPGIIYVVSCAQLFVILKIPGYVRARYSGLPG